jgi:hypothetical protein
MIELDPKVVVEQQAEKDQRKEKTLLGTIFPHKGHTLYKLDLETEEVSLAKYSSDYNVDQTIPKKVIVEEGYYYVSALNKENALKKFRKGKSGSKR